MDQYLVAIAAYALAALLVYFFLAVEFARAPASVASYRAISYRRKAYFWLIVVPSFSAFPVLSFVSGYRVLAALFALFAPLALLWFRSTDEQQARLARA